MWDLVATLVKVAEDKRLDRIMSTAKVDFTAGIDSIRRIQVFKSQLSLGITLYRLVFATRQREASKKQDYIYGLFGLLDDGIRNHISIMPLVKWKKFSFKWQKPLPTMKRCF